MNHEAEEPPRNIDAAALLPPGRHRPALGCRCRRAAFVSLLALSNPFEWGARMSWQHVTAVLSDSRTTGPARAVLLVLAVRANERAECWPSLGRIAREAGLSRCTVARCLPKIVAAGELVILPAGKTVQTAGGPQKINLYRVAVRVGGSGQIPPCEAKGVADSSKGVADSSKGGSGEIPESSWNGKEPTEERGPLPLPGHPDYERAKIPSIRDYPDIYACPDPVLAALGVTRERGKRAWGAWTKVLNRGRRELGTVRADRLFRETVAELLGEMKAGELRKPGAAFNVKLSAAFGARITAAPPPETTSRAEALAGIAGIPAS